MTSAVDMENKSLAEGHHTAAKKNKLVEEIFEAEDKVTKSEDKCTMWRKES